MKLTPPPAKPSSKLVVVTTATNVITAKSSNVEDKTCSKDSKARLNEDS